MQTLVSSMSRSLPNMAWKIKIREEDLKHRTVLNTRRRIDDARRSVEEKMEQLKALAEISMIIAGFTISALCEIQVSENVSTTSLTLFGLFTSSTIAVTTISGLVSTFLLVGIYKYDTLGTQPFEEFWGILFESDWQIAFQAFVFGSFCFMLSLMQGSWVLYNDHEYGQLASIIVTVICVCSIIFWYVRVYTKWAGTLRKGYTNLQRSSISEYDIEYHDGEGDVQNSDDDNNENTEMHHNVEMQRVNEEEIEESINMSMNVDVESDNEFYGYEMSS